MEEDHERLSHLANRVELPKHITPEEEAASLRIPEHIRARPEAQAFCAVVAEADNLLTHLDEVRSGGTVDRDAQPELRRAFGDPDTTEELIDRYTQAELIMRGVVHLLKQGMQDEGDSAESAAGYAVSKIDAAIRGYGYKIVREDGSPRL